MGGLMIEIVATGIGWLIVIVSILGLFFGQGLGTAIGLFLGGFMIVGFGTLIFLTLKVTVESLEQRNYASPVTTRIVSTVNWLLSWWVVIGLVFVVFPTQGSVQSIKTLTIDHSVWASQFYQTLWRIVFVFVRVPLSPWHAEHPVYHGAIWDTSMIAGITMQVMKYDVSFFALVLGWTALAWGLHYLEQTLFCVVAGLLGRGSVWHANYAAWKAVPLKDRQRGQREHDVVGQGGENH